MREQQRVEREGPNQTWWQQGERFAWFVLAALIGIAFSKLGAPALEKYVFPYIQGGFRASRLDTCCHRCTHSSRPSRLRVNDRCVENACASKKEKALNYKCC